MIVVLETQHANSCQYVGWSNWTLSQFLMVDPVHTYKLKVPDCNVIQHTVLNYFASGLVLRHLL